MRSPPHNSQRSILTSGGRAWTRDSHQFCISEQTVFLPRERNEPPNAGCPENAILGFSDFCCHRRFRFLARRQIPSRACQMALRPTHSFCTTRSPTRASRSSSISLGIFLICILLIFPVFLLYLPAPPLYFSLYLPVLFFPPCISLPLPCISLLFPVFLLSCSFMFRKPQ